MNVTVFGAGGRTGRRVVAEALARGHAVTAVVRRPPDPPLDPAATIFRGDARDPEAASAALKGADAVLSAMGPVGEAPGTVYSEAITSLVAAMETGDRRRLVITANARVLDDRPLTGAYAGVSEEHRRALATLRTSTLDWTVVATPMLTDGAPAGRYDAALKVKGDGHDIDRSDFASAVVDALDRDEWIGHVLAVTTEERRPPDG